jgi:hypothetical protein
MTHVRQRRHPFIRGFTAGDLIRAYQNSQYRDARASQTYSFGVKEKPWPPMEA